MMPHDLPLQGVSGAARAFSIWVKATDAEPGAALFVTGKEPMSFPCRSPRMKLKLAGAVTLTGSTSLLDGMWHQVMVS